ncbi:hypothetical protein ASG01_10215 [Chryseobacterium sp. Leaf180]|uniref:glycosyltransferase family 4 protein n=1 Tax=Chryseobacterium sp. Leaf180 TaxID=1736289 RepID=UPI0006F67D1D|nr:glycosyltransferase family 1 protein [Chryseobacterium sp. Leaf180]KQR93538.1 hypothetical protein ASG01_10215 [Chryseobacterium sp. Leaf180]
MKIVFDNIIFWLQKSGGISVYWYELINNFTKYPDQNITFLNLDEDSDNINFPNLSDQNVVSEKKKWKYFNRFFSLYVVETEKFIFHSSYYRICKSAEAVNITTVHDFTMDFLEKGLRRKIHYHLKRYAIKRSQGIICISENTKNDLFKLHPWVDPATVKVIYNGVGYKFKIINNAYEIVSQKIPNIDKNKKYLLFVGSRANYKNFDVAVDSVSILDSVYHLLIVGKNLTNTEELFLQNKIAGRYSVVSDVSEDYLNAIYNIAFCLLYPSKYEGFGIPPLEAMKAGCPVIAANASSIPEVVGNAGILINRITSRSIAEAVMFLENDDIRNDFVNKGLINAQMFSWEKNFYEHKLFYEEIYDRNKNRFE